MVNRRCGAALRRGAAARRCGGDDGRAGGGRGEAAAGEPSASGDGGESGRDATADGEGEGESTAEFVMPQGLVQQYLFLEAQSYSVDHKDSSQEQFHSS